MDKSVKELNKKLAKVENILDELPKTSNFEKVDLNKINEIREILSLIEPPQPKCATCHYCIEINKRNLKNGCEIKMMPKKVKVGNTSINQYGCVFHTEF